MVNSPSLAAVTVSAQSDAVAVASSGLVNHAILQPGTAALVMAAHAKTNRDYEVVAVEIYRRDCIVKKVSPGTVSREPSKRGAVVEFSDKSMRKVVFVAKNCDCDFPSMITLTYPGEFPTDGRKVKKNLEAFRRVFLRRYQRRGLWWLEFQLRGAPHFHILCEVDLVDCGELVCRRRSGKRRDSSYMTSNDEEKWIARQWYEIVGSGDERHLRAGVAWEVIEKSDGALRYAAAHAAKRKQKDVPSGFSSVGRFWGVFGKVRVQREGVCRATAAEVFQAYGVEALSSRGRVRKYLYDGKDKFSYGEEI